MGNILVSIIVFILIALILTCIAILISNLARPKLGQEDVPLCEPVEFCTKKEQTFFEDISTIAEKQGLLVFSKVGLGCVLKPRKGVEYRDLWSKQLRGEYADFILCDPTTLKTMVVIMLDDSGLSLQKTRVGMVDKACEMANVPLMHVREYNLTGLEKALLQKLGPRKRTSRATAPLAKKEELNAS